MPANQDEKWVFGYGSLMWRPGFNFIAQREARVHGFHRSLCVYSHVHRGTPERPGLVLGLDRGGSCRGVAFQVQPQDWRQTLDYLRVREQTTMVYQETYVDVTFRDGARRTALVYTIDRRHRQYAGRLAIADMLRHIQQGVGQSGPNPEYVLNTHAHLEELGVHDWRLAKLATMLRDS